MQLWPHQQYAIDELKRLISSGARRICVQAATGAGKSVVMRTHIEQHSVPTALYTDRKMLMAQLGRGLDADGFLYGVRAAGVEPRLLEDIQLCMVQTEYSRAVNKGRDIHRADHTIWDEAHRFNNPTAAALRELHLKRNPNVVEIGFTATPLGLGGVYDEMIVAGTNSELRDCGALVPAYHYAPDEPDTKLVGRVTVGEGECGIPNAKRMQYATRVFGSVEKHYWQYNPEQKPTILFAPGVRESLWFAQTLSERGIPSAHLDGKNIWIDGETFDTNDDKRQELADRLQSGDIKVVTNRFCLDDQTEILTDTGWVGMDAMTKEHRVANWDNGHVFFAPPKEVIRRKRMPDERMVVLETPRRSIRVTENHQMLYRTDLVGPFHKCEAKDLVDQYVGIPVCSANPRLAPMTWVPEYTYKFQFEDGWKDEEVWCVECDSGNIITRRKGSATVMGNCLREGIDWPWVEFGIFATIFGSLTSYIQAGGRILRASPSTGKTHATIIDHGGCWHRHGSLNANREWKLEYTDRIVAGLREDRIRKGEEPEPITCPECNAVRLSGPTCPVCKFRYEGKVRKVLQADGSLREMKGDIFRKRRHLTYSEKLERDWCSRVKAVKNSKKEHVRNMTFTQLEVSFARDHNWQYPPRELPMMPVNEIDWYLPVSAVKELT